MPKPTTDHRVSVTLDLGAEMAQRLRDEADRRGVSLSKLVGLMVEHSLPFLVPATTDNLFRRVIDPLDGSQLVPPDRTWHDYYREDAVADSYALDATVPNADGDPVKVTRNRRYDEGGAADGDQE